jgi:hypothetical protein
MLSSGTSRASRIAYLRQHPPASSSFVLCLYLPPILSCFSTTHKSPTSGIWTKLNSSAAIPSQGRSPSSHLFACPYLSSLSSSFSHSLSFSSYLFFSSCTPRSFGPLLCFLFHTSSCSTIGCPPPPSVHSSLFSSSPFRTLSWH